MPLRKLLFSLLLTLPFISIAQNPLNGGFEDTTIVSNDTVPMHWSADFLGFAFTSDAHSGSQAAMVWNWYHYVEGWVSYGNATNGFDGGGLPISFNPDRLTGWYKYSLGENAGAADSAVCEIMLYSHQNFTGARDTIAHVWHKFGPVGEYTAFDVPITYRMPGIPADTLVLRFLSSENGFCNPSPNCLYLTIDDLVLSSPTAVAPLMAETISVAAWPSPGDATFSLQGVPAKAWPLEIQLIDAAGRTAHRSTMHHDADGIETRQLAAGLYRWAASGHDGSRFTGTWLKQH